MTGPGLRIQSLAPGASVQDRGRPGLQRFGVTGGGAMDMVALAEGQILLGNPPAAAALELAMAGGRFVATGPLVIATSGAEMALSVNGTQRPWRAVIDLEAGDVVEIGAARSGVYGYLHLTGGLDVPPVLGSRATHARAGLGPRIEAGMVLR
ncbi:MAG: urea amidolyase, partial [Alphaproteobacteria bacterium]